MLEVRVVTEIAAPPERVWDLMADLSGYPDWNPLLRRVTDRGPTTAVATSTAPGSARDANTSSGGEDLVESSSRPLSPGPVSSAEDVRLGAMGLRPGHPITLHIALAAGETPIDVTLNRGTTGSQLGWSFHERAPWLYRGEHFFSVEPTDGGSRFVDVERFWGLLVPVRRRRLRQRITASMTLMGTALKATAESAPGSGAGP